MEVESILLRARDVPRLFFRTLVSVGRASHR